MSSFIADTNARKVSIGPVLANEVKGLDRILVNFSRVLSLTDMMFYTNKSDAMTAIQALNY